MSNGKYYYDFGDVFLEKYRLMQPDEVFKYKIGICQDQALFKYYVLTNLGYDCKVIFFQMFGSDTHTFLIYKLNDKLYNFENSFYDYRGIPGPYENYNEIYKDVYDAMRKYETVPDVPDKRYMCKKVDTKKLLWRYDITWIKYCLIVGYDFDKE